MIHNLFVPCSLTSYPNSRRMYSTARSRYLSFTLYGGDCDCISSRNWAYVYSSPSSAEFYYLSLFLTTLCSSLQRCVV